MSQFARRWRAACWLLGGTLLVLLGLLNRLPTSLDSLFAPIVAVDRSQSRLDISLPAPTGVFTLQQSFVPHRDGLREIELLLVRWDENADGRFWLKLHDDDGHTLAEQWVDSRGVAHNQVHSFRFPAQSDSAGRRYTLELGGSPTNPLSAWGYSLDVVDDGRLQIIPVQEGADTPTTAAQDLRFTTHYQLAVTGAGKVLGQLLREHGLYLLLALALIPLPGGLLLFLPRGRWPQWDMAAWWGASYALGAAVWPLIWYALTLLGGRWRGWSLWLLFVAGWLILLILWLRRQRRPVVSSSHPHVLLLILCFGLTLRLLAVRDINIPPWVDASRHALITSIMVAKGQTPSDYWSLLPIDNFPYHFGFHTLPASLGLMTAWPLPDTLLYLGQLLNALLPLTVYTAVWLVTRRPWAGTLAAFLVAIPFFFPAYYATWGRFTQLTAMLIMPLLLALTWLLLRGGRAWRRYWWVVGLLAAGLFLVHVRVFLFYVPLVGVIWLLSKGRNGRYLAAAALLALLLVTPRAEQLWTTTAAPATVSSRIAGYNAFPDSYLRVGWEVEFVWLAAACLPLLLLASLRRRTWSAFPYTLVMWVALLFLLLAGDRLGLPETTLVNLNSMYITLFLPLALFLGVMLERAGRWWLRQPVWLQIPGHIAIAGVFMAALLFGARQQIGILNEQTILAYPADREGLAWAADHLPATTKVAVNSWLWLGSTWTGSDGGAWLLPLAQLQSTTPPADYVYERQLIREVAEFNGTATAVDDWADPAQVVWLQTQGVTHIFVGARGGFFDPAKLAQNPALQMVYSADGVFIFQVR
ncbi:MAG: hypothetical protein IAE79_16960 [Anaerolinea sp.]|nr:hypothetical protein [Anaerolinea sp.]